MIKYISALAAFLLVTVAFAANTIASHPAAPASVASLLHDYDYIQGEIDALRYRAGRIEADIDTMATDLRVYDARMGELSDSMIHLRRSCGEYLVMARKIRKTSPDLSPLTSRKKVYSSIRRNGYINADIFKAQRELRDLTDNYFRVFNEKERIKYLVDHESDLYAMHDNIMDRIETLEARAGDVMELIDPYRDRARAILESRNACAARLDRELAYIVRVKRDKPGADPKPETIDDVTTQAPETVVLPTLSAFETNKGMMMFPVSGKYNIIGRFGTYTHPEFQYITINNPGIDIEAVDGAKARVVFPGKVEAIYDIKGYNKVVVVSHGDYYTVYGNLSDLNVTEGMEVKDGQVVGAISAEGGHTVLHFEVRYGTAALDPVAWIKR